MADFKNTEKRSAGEPEDRPSLVLDRPADKSLAAFNQCINEMFDALIGDESDERTEEKWCKVYWSSGF